MTKRDLTALKEGTVLILRRHSRKESKIVICQKIGYLEDQYIVTVDGEICSMTVANRGVYFSKYHVESDMDFKSNLYNKDLFHREEIPADGGVI